MTNSRGWTVDPRTLCPPQTQNVLLYSIGKFNFFFNWTSRCPIRGKHTYYLCIVCTFSLCACTVYGICVRTYGTVMYTWPMYVTRTHIHRPVVDLTYMNGQCVYVNMENLGDISERHDFDFLAEKSIRSSFHFFKHLL